MILRVSWGLYWEPPKDGIYQIPAPCVHQLAPSPLCAELPGRVDNGWLLGNIENEKETGTAMFVGFTLGNALRMPAGLLTDKLGSGRVT